jgi:regulator of replication initiation timing
MGALQRNLKDQKGRVECVGARRNKQKVTAATKNCASCVVLANQNKLCEIYNSWWIRKIQDLEERREAVEGELWSTIKTRELSETTHRDTAASSVPEVKALQSRIAELVEENEVVITENKRLAEELEAIRAKADALLAAAKDTLENSTREKKEMYQSRIDF